jgi:hypothetical protein
MVYNIDRRLKTMATQAPSDSQKPDVSRERLDELLEKAMEQPGIRDVMYVYDAWRHIDETCRPHFDAMDEQPSISVSNATSPCFSIF